MKNVLFIFLLMLTFSACEKVDYLEPHPNGDGTVNIIVSSQKADTIASFTNNGRTTFMVESNKFFIFSYETDLEVDYQIWEFWDGQLSYEESPSYFYGGYDIKEISLTIVDVDGFSHYTNSDMNLFARYPNSPYIITNVSASGSDDYLLTAGVYKNAWYGVSGNYYLFGTITSNPWNDYQLINPADTNYRMSANANLFSVTQEVGHWVKSELLLAPGDHSFGIVRFDGEDPIWGNFKNSQYVLDDNPTLISFHLTNDGQVIPVTPLPGEHGDQGPLAVLRYTIHSNNSVSVFVNLDENFSSGNPWWSYLDHNETWYTATSLAYVPDFSNWGKFTVNSINDFPIRMIWGLYANQNNSNMAQSMYWVSYYQYIYLNIMQ